MSLTGLARQQLPHVPYIFALLVLALVFLSSWWLSPNSHTLGDVITYYYPRAVMLKQSIFEYNDFLPLWNPYIFSGDPFLAKPNTMNFFFILGPLLLFLPPMAALHWNVIIALFLSAAFMYAFVNYLSGSRKAAFVSALVYLLSGFVLTTVIFYGWVVFANAYMLFPLLFLFLFRAYRESLVSNSVYAGVVLGLILIAGSGIEFLYATVLVGLFLSSKLLSRKFASRAVKSAIIGLVVVSVCFGLSAFKLLPVLEYQKLSVRDHLSWENASGRVLHASKFFSDLVEPGFPKFFQSPSNKVGIFAFMLVVLAVAHFLYRAFKRTHFDSDSFYFIIVASVSLLLASGSFLLYLFWKFYPGWGAMRYANRAIIMLVPAAAVLAGIGAKELFALLKARFRLNGKAISAVFAAVSVLIVLDLAVFGSGGQSNAGDERYKYRDIDEAVAANRIMQNLSVERQNSIFRIHTLETRGIDWGTEFYTVPLKLENIFGYDTQWINYYLRAYLGAAENYPAKLWGMLNVKYVTSMQPMNIPGFRLAAKFDECGICFPEEPAIQKAWGPYLYENELFVPRAYTIDSAVLVLGNSSFAERMGNSLLSLPEFDPKKTVFVSMDGVLRVGAIDSLKRYRMVIAQSEDNLAGVDDPVWKRYISEGGAVLVARTNTIELGEADYKKLWAIDKPQSFAAIHDGSIITRSFSKKEVILPSGSKGRFLVLSERYGSFPGWHARADGRNLEVLSANGALTAVYLDGEYGRIVFEYRPASFVAGSYITMFTLAALSVAAAVSMRRKARGIKPKQKNEVGAVEGQKL